MIDKKDKKILKEMLKDGRKSFANLARACRMTRQSIFSRTKSLKRRRIIKNFTVNLNPEKLDLNLKAYIIVTADPTMGFRKKAAKTLSNLPQISQIHQLFGRFDFLIEVLVKDISELTKILSKIHELETVTRTETMIVHTNIKYDPHHPMENALG